MRVVLDTNVFISAVFFGGAPAKILHAWRDGHIILILSPDILDEYRQVGERLHQQFPAIDVSPFLQRMITKAELVDSPPLPSPVCDDLDDDKFLACALSGKAQVVVSGDKHLLKVDGYREISVMSPRQFLADHL